MSRITQLHRHLELLSEGEPPRHSLFVLEQEPGQAERLLLIDPPGDVAERFTLPPQVLTLATSPGIRVAGQPVRLTLGQVAHVRVGEHLLDIHARPGRAVVLFPALGILVGGDFGSDLALPALAPGSDGAEELEVLRLLARLVKERERLLYIPRVGSLSEDKITVMTRLAEDVAYLHGLRRTVPSGMQRGEGLPALQQATLALLPEDRRSPVCVEIHRRNVAILHRVLGEIE